MEIVATVLKFIIEIITTQIAEIVAKSITEIVASLLPVFAEIGIT